MTVCPQGGPFWKPGCANGGRTEASTWQWAEARLAGPLSSLSLQPSSPSDLPSCISGPSSSLCIRCSLPAITHPCLCLCLQGHPARLCVSLLLSPFTPAPSLSPRAPRLQTHRSHICPNPNPANETAPSGSGSLWPLLTWGRASEPPRPTRVGWGGVAWGGERRRPPSGAVFVPSTHRRREGRGPRGAVRTLLPQALHLGSPTYSKTPPPPGLVSLLGPSRRPIFQIALQAPPSRSGSPR